MTTDNAMDHRARRAAKRAGLVARKSRRGLNTLDNEGGYSLFRPDSGFPVCGWNFDLTAEDVIEYCNETDAA